MLESWIIGFGILAGLLLTLWLRERPDFNCYACSTKLKYWQPHCNNCGRKLIWKGIKKIPYIHSQRNKKWMITVPIEEKQLAE